MVSSDLKPSAMPQVDATRPPPQPFQSLASDPTPARLCQRGSIVDTVSHHGHEAVHLAEVHGRAGRKSFILRRVRNAKPPVFSKAADAGFFLLGLPWIQVRLPSSKQLLSPFRLCKIHFSSPINIWNLNKDLGKTSFRIFQVPC